MGEAIFHVTTGRGTTLVAVHGGPGLDHTYLRPGLAPLEDVFGVAYLDLTGNGRSSRPSSWDSVTHDTWVEDIESVRRATDSEQIVLFGHSYGGFIAQEYALKYPERLAALILCATAPALDYADRLVANAMSRGKELGDKVVSALSAPVQNDRAFEEVWYSILPLYFHGPETPYRRHFAATRFSSDAYNRAFFGLIAGFNTLSRLGALQVPTLILSGRHDWTMPVDLAGERLAAAVPQARHELFERSGHFMFYEEADRFQHIVRDWARETLGARVPG